MLIRSALETCRTISSSIFKQAACKDGRCASELLVAHGGCASLVFVCASGVVWCLLLEISAETSCALTKSLPRSRYKRPNVAKDLYSLKVPRVESEEMRALSEEMPSHHYSDEDDDACQL